MKPIIILCIFVSLTLFNATYTQEPWVSRYLFSLKKSAQCKQDYTVTHVGRHSFTQLLFGWHAQRPASGYFSFHVKVRDAATHRWGKWHKAASWGDQVQRSFHSVSDGMSSYVHVRLEMHEQCRADGFAIKIVSHDGASLQAVHALYATAADYSMFKAEDAKQLSLPSCLVRGVPRIAQYSLPHAHAASICSPTAVTMLINYLTDKQLDPLVCAQQGYDYGLAAYGSWPFNMAYATTVSDGVWQCMHTRLHGFSELHSYLMRNLPVVVSVRGALKGAAKSFNAGHLLLVIGYDAQKKLVLCHDPAAYADEDVCKEYLLEDFLCAWERSRRLAYVVKRA